MKGVKLFVNILIDILIVILVIGILMAFYGFIETKVKDKKYANYFGFTYFQILTGSMERTISVDDVVLVKITKNAKENDIISYKEGDVVVTHRVIKVTEGGYITKGDNNNVEDGLIAKDDVIGKVIFIGKQYGKLKKFIFEPVVIIPFILTIILFNIYVALEKKEKGA